MKYSREDEANLPDFQSHDEARKYFKEKHGNNFQMVGSDYIDNRKIYFYNLILDGEEYQKGHKELRSEGIVFGKDFMLSYQSIEIWEDGQVHMIH